MNRSNFSRKAFSTPEARQALKQALRESALLATLIWAIAGLGLGAALAVSLLHKSGH